jgi:hypothetical protein
MKKSVSKMRSLICYTAGGLGNRIFPLASSIEYAKGTGRKLYLYWPRDIRCDVNFSDLFDEDITVVDDTFLNNLKDEETSYYIRHQASADNDLLIYGRRFLSSKPSPYRKIRHDSSADTTKNLLVCNNHFLSEVPLEISKNRVRKLLVKSHIWDSIKAISKNMGLDKEVQGVHLRGTDFPTSDGWEQCILLASQEDKKVFVCSDDPALEQRAKAQFPDHVLLRENKHYVSKNNPANPSWSNNVYSSPESLADSIKDLYLLGKTTLVYYNNASTFGEYAKILSEL